MGMVYTIANEKGGQAKTTTALALAEGAARRGHRILAIDADPQGALSYELMADKDSEAPGLYEILVYHADGEECAIATRSDGVYLWRASGSLAAIDAKLTGADRIKALQRALLDVYTGYDYIIIDCPAMVNTLQLAALMAADDLLIPATPDAYSMRSISHTLQSMETAKECGNKNLRLAGVLFTRCRSLTAHKSILSAARAAMGDQILHTVIRERASVQTAALLHESIWADGMARDTAADYDALLDELKIPHWEGRKK